MTLVVNLVAGPGTGKSTTAAGTFFELKQRGVNCELVTEYAKDAVWGRTTATLDNQIYIFAKQHHRLFRLLGQVDVIVTDCPLFLSMYYGREMSNAFHHLVKETWDAMTNMTFFLERVKDYNPAGRVQTEEKAREIDQELWQMLIAYDVGFEAVIADRLAPDIIAQRVMKELGRSTT